MKETSVINGEPVFPTINFKTMLYLLVSIAVLFIAIIPARIISGIFSQDVSIFYISFAGFTVLLEFMVWCFLCVPMKIYESILADKAMDEKLIVAEEQPGSKLPNEEVVSGESEMLLAMKEETKDIITPSSMIDLYRQGCDDFYRNQASHRKEQLDKIMEYLHYTMAPFIKQDDMETFCAEIMSFAINPAYEPKPFVGLKGTLTSFDVRHLIWNITSRLGLGKGKPYSVELCINFIRTMFPDLCKDLDNSTLKNLRVTSTSDKIHIDFPGSMHTFTLPVKSYQQFPCANDATWTVRIPEDLLAEIRLKAKITGQKENGGYLFGHIDYKRRILYLLNHFMPRDSKGTKSGFRLGTSGLKDYKKMIAQRSIDQVEYIGDWHSHPACALDMSAIDLTTCALDVLPQLKNGIGLCVITKTNDTKFFLLSRLKQNSQYSYD